MERTDLEKENDSLLENVPTVPLDMINFFNHHVVGQQAAKSALAVALSNHFKRLRYEQNLDLSGYEKIPKSNVMLIGSTGTGKTMLCELAADYIGVPFINLDATSITEAGYVGEDVESIPRLLHNITGSIKRTEMGIVHIDEIDKIATVPTSGIDVSRSGAQNALLSIIDGRLVNLYPEYDHRHKRGIYIDTKNILFIMSGAFDGLVDILKKDSASIGFGGNVNTPELVWDQLTAGEFEITEKNFDKYGFNTQFLGRVSRVSCLHQLNKQHLRAILELKACPVLVGKSREFAADNINLRFTDDGLDALADMAASYQRGGRGIKKAVDVTLEPFQRVLPSTGYSGNLEIDRDAVLTPEKYLDSFVEENQLSIGDSIEDFCDDEFIPIRENIGEQEYESMLESIGMPNIYIRPATQIGRKQNLEPEEMNFAVNEMLGFISDYKAQFKKDYGVTVNFTESAVQSLIISALETGNTSIDNYFYIRISQHIENRSFCKKAGPKLTINHSDLTNPKGLINKYLK